MGQPPICFRVKDFEEKQEKQLKHTLYQLANKYDENYLKSYQLSHQDYDQFKSYLQVYLLMKSNFSEKIIRQTISETPIIIANRNNFPEEKKIIESIKKKDFVQIISKDLKSNQKNLFHQLKRIYFNFLNQFFELNNLHRMNSNIKDDRAITPSFYSANVVTINIYSAQQYPLDEVGLNQQTINPSLTSENTCSFTETLQKQINRQLSEFVLHQCNFMFLLLRELIRISHGHIFEIFLNQDENNFPSNEIILERIIQHFLMADNSPLIRILPEILIRYYQPSQEKSEKHEKRISNLDQLFFPLEVSNIEEFELSDSFLQSSSASLQQESTNQFQEQLRLMLQKSAYQCNQENIPYSNTFNTLLEIARCHKPWRKFKLIEKFSNQVVQLFLRKRTLSQFDKFSDLISEEDTKTEILIKVSECGFRISFHVSQIYERF